jgi:excisionase family DNA binding protein
MIKTKKPLKPEMSSTVSVAEARLLTVGDVAERLQVSGRTVHRLIDAKELAVIRIGRSVRVSEEAVQALLTRGDMS